jgi:hypothetical protein
VYKNIISDRILDIKEQNVEGGALGHKILPKSRKVS